LQQNQGYSFVHIFANISAVNNILKRWFKIHSKELHEINGLNKNNCHLI
jgi:hypothetical protein